MNNTFWKNIRRYMRFAVILILAAVSVDAAAFSSGYFAGDSRLSKGRWVKIKVKDTGVHQITDIELKEMGFADPSKVAVFGFPAVSLSDYKLTERTPDDLPPVPAIRHGEKLIFYGEADVRNDIYQNGSSATGINLPVRVTRNFYADFGTYFLTDAYAGKEPQKIPASGDTGDFPAVTSGFGMVHYEEETSNKGEIGPFFFGSSFVDERRQAYSFEMPGFLDGTGIYVQMAAAFQVSISGNVVITPPSGITGQITVPATSLSSYVYNGLNWVGKDFPASSPEGLYSVVFDASSLPYINFGALDYFTVTYERDNTFSGGQQRMAYSRLSQGSRIQIPTNVQDMMVWDVSDPYDIRSFEVSDCSAELSADAVVPYLKEIFSPAAYSVSSGNPASIVAFDPDSQLLPVSFAEEVACQNLHALAVPRMIVISSRRMYEEAERLAQAHRDIDGIDVAVVCQDDVYNEFSSGTPHVTALRRFVKMLYDREPGKLKSVLLFGAGSYDSRDIPNGGRQEFRETHIPLLQQEDFRLSGHRSKSYITDSFVGMMAEDSDEEPFNIYTRHMDVNVARIPAENIGDARAVVDKTIRYMSAPPSARAVNSALLMCDKGDALGHMGDSQMLDSAIMHAAPSTVVYKGYNTIFPKNNGHADELHRYISNMLSKGVGYWSYSGHATPYSFGSEPIWDINLVQQTDYDMPPFTVFATCRALYFDHPGDNIGEVALYKPNGGSIAVIGALREVFKEKNQVMNVEAGKYFYSATGSTTAGDVFRLARRSSVSTPQSMNNDLIINTLSYNLIGDPEIRIHRPQFVMNITDVNGEPFDSSVPVSLSSAEKVIIGGCVTDREGNVVTDFNGDVTLSLFDGSRIAKVLNVGNTSMENSWLGYEVPMADEIIFETLDKVENGRFRFSVVIPAPQRPGKANRMTFIASSDDGGMQASGSIENITVEISGSMPETGDDTLPEITSMYINDSKFADGDVVTGDLMFHAEIAPNQFVVAGHSAILGQSASLALDGGARMFANAPLVFKSDTEGGGTIELPLTDIADGYHTLTLKVKNYAGQSTERTINFTVVNVAGQAKLSVEEYPASTVATINLDCDSGDIPVGRLIVKDASGKVVFTENGVTFPYRWDLRTTGGDIVPDGLYTIETYFNIGLRYGSAAPAKMVVRRGR